MAKFLTKEQYEELEKSSLNNEMPHFGFFDKKSQKYWTLFQCNNRNATVKFGPGAKRFWDNCGPYTRLKIIEYYKHLMSIKIHGKSRTLEKCPKWFKEILIFS